MPLSIPGDPLESWVADADLAAAPGATGASATVRAFAAQTATEMLWALSGRRWSGQRTATVQLSSRHCQHLPSVGRSGRRPDGMFDVYDSSIRERNAWCGCHLTVDLPDRPVREITALLVDGLPLLAPAWRLDDRHRLVRQDGGSWPIGDERAPRLTITYVHGQEPPQGARDAALILAAALCKARTSGASCGLPSRVTQVAAEGVTVVLDNFDAFRQGGTGIAPVDLWLFTVNPNRLTRSAVVLSPDSPRPSRPAVY